MKILIAPDKFKDSLTAIQVCNAIEEGVGNVLNTSEITKIPLADGGEGSLNVLEKSIQFKRIFLNINNPVFKKTKTYYGLLDDVAFVELAQASGLQLLRPEEYNPLETTTLGTGEMIFDAIKRGAKKIFLFVGGSATNDAGIGIASALGFRFEDKNGKALVPVGKNLIKIKHISKRNVVLPNNIEVNILTDVDNVLYGKGGAAYVFAKQKGADKKEIQILEDGLKNFSEVIIKEFGKDISKTKGGGAAGGVGAGAIVFCNAKIKSGIDTIINLLNLDAYIQQSDLVITGEGLLDEQTLQGKVVKGVMNRCAKMKKTLAIICGDTTLTENKIEQLSVVSIKTIKRKNISQENSMIYAYSYLVKRAEELIRELTFNSL